MEAQHIQLGLWHGDCRPWQCHEFPISAELGSLTSWGMRNLMEHVELVSPLVISPDSRCISSLVSSKKPVLRQELGSSWTVTP